MQNKIVNCNGIEISNKNKICLIAGPCQLETEQHAMDMVGKIKEITENIVKQIPTLIDKKMDLFSSKVNQNLNGI